MPFSLPVSLIMSLTFFIILCPSLLHIYFCSCHQTPTSHLWVRSSSSHSSPHPLPDFSLLLFTCSFGSVSVFLYTSPLHPLLTSSLCLLHPLHLLFLLLFFLHPLLLLTHSVVIRVHAIISSSTDLNIPQMMCSLFQWDFWGGDVWGMGRLLWDDRC